LKRPDFYPVKNVEGILKIRFDCELNERIHRVLKRDFKKEHGRDPSVEEVAALFEVVKQKTISREEVDALRYRKHYGIHDVFVSDYFDEIIDTTGMTLAEQVDETFATFTNYVEL
jgi:cytidylate kinase